MGSSCREKISALALLWCRHDYPRSRSFCEPIYMFYNTQSWYEVVAHVLGYMVSTASSLSANSANTSPWQASGLHQQPSVFPLRLGGICFINWGLARIQSLYLRITSCLVPSLPIMKGLPHFDGLPIYTS